MSKDSDFDRYRRFGKPFGFALSFTIFTFVPYAIFSYTKKLPAGWEIYHVAFAVALLTLAGIALKRWLYE